MPHYRTRWPEISQAALRWAAALLLSLLPPLSAWWGPDGIPAPTDETCLLALLVVTAVAAWAGLGECLLSAIVIAGGVSAVRWLRQGVYADSSLEWRLPLLLGALILAAWWRPLRRHQAAVSRGRDDFACLMRSSVLPMKLDDLRTGVVIDANDAFLALLGRDRSEVIGARWGDFSPPEYHEADCRARRAVLSYGHTTPYEHAYCCPTGEIPVRLSLVLLDATSERVLCIAQDLRSDRLLNEQMSQRTEQLQIESRRKDEFLAMLGHELRNPLTPILNAAELLGMDGVDQSQRDRYRRIVRDQVAVLTRLVDDLLDAARIQQGKVQLRTEPCNLKAVVEAAVEAARAEMTDRRHQVFVATPERPVWTLADPKRMNQVIVNLLSNAAKYTEPGGSVWVSLSAEGRHCVIRVRDTGRGIDPVFLPRVWDMFAQEKVALDDRPTGGLGLGLTLVKRLVEMHGGGVESFSQGRDQGSEFVVRLPCTALSWRLHPRPAAAPLPTSMPLDILVVDDHYSVAETTAGLLKMDGHRVSVAHDAASAIAMDSRMKPQVILLDIGLPGMNGFQAASLLREQSPDVHLIAVTGYGGEESRQHGDRAGFNRYMVKPVDPAVLRAALADVARRHYHAGDNATASGEDGEDRLVALRAHCPPPATASAEGSDKVPPSSTPPPE